MCYYCYQSAVCEHCRGCGILVDPDNGPGNNRKYFDDGWGVVNGLCDECAEARLERYYIEGLAEARAERGE
jgi:hypothetical protein